MLKKKARSFGHLPYIALWREKQCDINEASII